MPQLETYLPPYTLRFSTRTIRAYCRCGVCKILKRRGTRLANDDITPQAYLFIYAGSGSLRRAKDETLILAAKQVQASVEKNTSGECRSKNQAGAFAPNLAL
ncbi:hypothetical protein [uncultured Campylobacter sp.]|uniref:hypothetical protein n=1 Tax=uncultured Campylobacter sp. TaxID=218934 RepID=UPI002616A48C|nr:hypothetical protein [uncultured Campylobacter sp.]